jgi:hypothetical protein
MSLVQLLPLMPLVSLATLAAISLFNVGYFSEIGLHFAGVVDLTNLVYSFGLVFPIVVGLLQAASGNLIGLLFIFAKNEDAYKKFRKFLLWVMLPGFVFGVAAFIYFGREPSHEVVAAIFLGFFLVALQGAIIDFHRSQKSDWGWAALAMAFALICIVYVGRAVAYNQVHDLKNSYSLTTKELTLANVRLIRSSSNGFIVVVADRIMFFPREEIKHIRSNTDVK